MNNARAVKQIYPSSTAVPTGFEAVAEQFREVYNIAKPTCLLFIDAMIAEALTNLLAALDEYDCWSAEDIVNCSRAVSECNYLAEPMRLHVARRLEALPADPSSSSIVITCVKAALRVVESGIRDAWVRDLVEELGTVVTALEHLSGAGE